ncbi:MAG: M48 family metalloprotease, partial [Candidatus Omnitrophica bacterium]|nr:M48 family metalloprotease [Candidatus Omnitrophota bacterium]
SGYSQEQELEADQLGIRYVSRAGFEPWAALDLLQDFSRFDYPWPFLRTHPYMSLRRDYLARYLAETRPVSDTIFEKVSDTGTARKALQDAQRLYPKGSVSWQNLQRQLDALDR